MEIVLVSLLNGLVYGMLLFMLASGLTLIFSMMGVLNFAHASIYMIGAYLAFTVSQFIGFFPALIIAPILCGLLGAAIEVWGLRRVAWQRPYRRAAVHLRPRLHHPARGADDLGHAADGLSGAAAVRFPAVHLLRRSIFPPIAASCCWFPPACCSRPGCC